MNISAEIVVKTLAVWTACSVAFGVAWALAFRRIAPDDEQDAYDQEFRKIVGGLD